MPTWKSNLSESQVVRISYFSQTDFIYLKNDPCSAWFA